VDQETVIVSHSRIKTDIPLMFSQITGLRCEGLPKCGSDGGLYPRPDDPLYGKEEIPELKWVIRPFFLLFKAL